MLSCVARPNLHACHVGADVGEQVALVAYAIIRVGTSVSAAAETARVVGTVINVDASLSVAIEAIWTGIASIADQWRKLVVARNASETRRRRTFIMVAAQHSVTNVACATRAAVASWTFVAADRVRTTVVVSCVTWSDLNACATTTSRINIHGVASITVTRVLPDAGVNTVAVQPTRRAVAIRIMACYASGVGSALREVNHPHRALTTRKPFARCSNIGAGDAHVARVTDTSISVNTRVPIACVSSVAGTGVLPWALVVAH